MKGFPKHINTMQDVNNLLVLYPTEIKAFLQSIISTNELNYWSSTGTLATASAGVTDDTHKVVTETDETGTDAYTQYELVADTNARMYRLGFASVAEVEAVINGN